MVREKKSVLVLACFVVMGFVASLIVGGCTPSSEGLLAAANVEANEVKKAALHFFEDNSVWPGTSNNLTSHYLIGTLKAFYDISDDYGWLLSANATENGWSDSIAFSPGVDGPSGRDGQWVKK